MKGISNRIKRNRLDQLSGRFFRDTTSELIQHLNSKGMDVLVGIQMDDGIYTVIGVEKVYFKTRSNREMEMRIGDFLDILNKVTLALGKNNPYEFIKIDESDSVWVMNAETMNALWNTMLALENKP